MQKKWLYRLILSYIPIIFAVIFCLMLVFFLNANQMMKKQAMRANLLFAGQVMQIMESTLRNIDTLASKNLLLDDKVASYFNSSNGQAPYDYYGVQGAIRDFMTPLTMIDSVYLYRTGDNKVLMHHFDSVVPQFGDSGFIREAMEGNSPYAWSGVRNLDLSEEMQPKSVVSLVRKVPYYSGAQGLIVINVRTSSVAGLLREMNPEGRSMLCLSDARGGILAGINDECGAASASKAEPPGKVEPWKVEPGKVDPGKEETPLSSAYTGWSLHVGLPQEGLFSFISTFSYIWFVLGFLVVIAGIGAMTLISHRHYRPLEQILGRIHTFAEKKGGQYGQSRDENEFAFIGSALESLIGQTESMEQLQEEGSLYRRIYLFKEVLEGSRRLSREEWLQETAQAGRSGPAGAAAVAIVELDLYSAFAARYSQRDQALFKFTLRSAIQEIADDEGESLWTEWLAPHRLGLLYRFSEGADERQSMLKIKVLSEKARAWVEQYLKFTVTVGLGSPIQEQDGERLQLSCLQAAAAVECKVSLGPNRVIAYDRQMKLAPEEGELDSLLHEIREAAQWFRIGHTDWEVLLTHIFQTVASGMYSRQDLGSLIRAFKTQLRREQQELSQEFQEVWASQVLVPVSGLPDDFEWVGEARQRMLTVLREADQPMQRLRMNREQYTLAAQVRSYISGHYTEPDLSLADVSEAFDVNLKTLSRIFKEEIGEKFVDYVNRVRIEHAKRLLAQTNEPVLRVSEQAGYLSSISFNRAFKKYIGMTPGDYRREQNNAGRQNL
ncbi:MAG: hypothetical protein K0R57_6542 [Paenibacillaceae bacterium]|jgi:AraC-like DNA-binding protein|nr:hypothetical protein [Paenibacillaceae bacterium]